jgi:long-subunit acyl-CoA synthetase (AMP-forming)
LLHQLVDSTTQAIFVQPELVPTLEKALSMAPKDYKIDPRRIILLCDYADKPKGTRYVAMQELWEKQKKPRQISATAEKETAYLCYSSGTTGRAKGVETSHHNMTSQVQAVNMSYEKLGVNDRILGVLPMGHIYGLTLLCHQPLTTGTPVIILPKFDVEQVFKAIEKVGV